MGGLGAIIKHRICFLIATAVCSTFYATEASADTYLGCYDETGTEEVFARHSGTTLSSLAPDRCREQCRKDLIYAFAGLWGGTHCYCAIHLTKLQVTQVNDSLCYSPCPGEPAEFCGGSNASIIFSIYSVYPRGLYGRRCANNCNCKDNQSCTVHGMCPGNECAAGWRLNRTIANRERCSIEIRCDPQTEFSCGNGRCVEIGRRCDRIKYDCAGGTDEFDCDVPRFQSAKDGPYDVNVTEGESITFNCNPFTIPEANITWLQNGQPIDTDNPSTRFVFSNDNKSLTIRDVCRDCVDRENNIITNQTVIQCNASNDYGYAFASGYLLVLMKTKVTIRGSKNVTVDFLEEKQFVFECNVTSDPSTPTTVLWYKTEPVDYLVHDALPYVNVTNEFLVINIHPQCSVNCAKYLGEYRCVGDNGHSRENRTVTLQYVYKPPPANSQKEETWAAWKTNLVAGAIGLGVLLVGIILHALVKQRSGDVNRQMKERRLPNLPSIYEDIGYDSVGLPLEELAGSGDGSMARAQSLYEHISYNSTDQVLAEIALREETSDEYGYNKYESIDSPEIEAMVSVRPMLVAGITCGEMPLDEVDQQEVHNYESVTNESEKCQKSNKHSEALNTYTGLSREEVNPNLDLGKSDSNRSEVNSYLELVSKEANPYLDLVSTEVNPYLDLVSKEVNRSLDPVSTEVKQYLDMGQKEVNQYMDLVPKEVNQYMDLSPKEANQYMDLVPKK